MLSAARKHILASTSGFHGPSVAALSEGLLAQKASVTSHPTTQPSEQRTVAYSKHSDAHRRLGNAQDDPERLHDCYNLVGDDVDERECLNMP
jgi:adenosylmethionine-8-amino-7-oxononanoate aminotransferase